MTRRQLATIASVGATVLIAAGCGGGGGKTSSSSSAAGSSKPASSSSGPMVSAKSTSLGTIVVDGSGRALYMFARDPSSRSTCSGACASNWPPFTASSKPAVGGGVSASAVSLIKRSGGKRQVALDGHPLYRYAGDQSPGQVNGQGISAFGAKWFALTPKGTKASRSAGSSSSGGSSPGGYGSGY